MTPIDVPEVGPGREVELDPATVHALREQALVDVTALGGGWWRLKAKRNSKVGIVRVGDVDLRITPKVPIARLLFMMGYYRNPVTWRDEDVSVGEADDLVTTMAYVFERQASRALRYGVLQGYRTVEETLPVMRGRLREADQLRRRHGLAIPLEVRYDEFTVDIPENRLLLAATDSLLQLPRVLEPTRRRLRGLRGQLGGVTPVRPRDPVPKCPPNRQNLRYRKALHLADMIVRARSAEAGDTGVPVSGFLLTMHRIFEDFVCVGLREELRDHGGDVTLQESMHLDDGGLLTLKPDLVWRSDSGTPLAVVDAKYMADRDNQHLYQIFSYCTVLGLNRGHLVYAKGPARPATHVIRRAGIEIIQHALDLDTTREDLLAQVRRLADAVSTP